MARTRKSHQKTLWPLYLIADMDTAQRLDVDLVDVVRDFVAAGGRMVSLRTGSGDDHRIMRIGRQVSAVVFSVGGTFLVHRRLDLGLLLGAQGIHLPARGFERRDVSQLMGRAALTGRSCHRQADVERAAEQGIDFVTLGPLFESVSKPGYGPKLDGPAFEDSVANIEIPVFALGGVLPDNVAKCFELGAAGIAVVGGILGADSPRNATRRYLRAIETAYQSMTHPQGSDSR